MKVLQKVSTSPKYRFSIRRIANWDFGEMTDVLTAENGRGSGMMTILLGGEAAGRMIKKEKRAYCPE